MKVKSIHEKPLWCPHKKCKVLRAFQSAMCIGELPKWVKHGKGWNTHRLCLKGVLKNKKIFDLQINKTDIYWFRLLFDAARWGVI